MRIQWVDRGNQKAADSTARADNPPADRCSHRTADKEDSRGWLRAEARLAQAGWAVPAQCRSTRWYHSVAARPSDRSFRQAAVGWPAVVGWPAAAAARAAPGLTSMTKSSRRELRRRLYVVPLTSTSLLPAHDRAGRA